jgi:RHO1 GDP-GTP exchange protein 1/2
VLRWYATSSAALSLNLRLRCLSEFGLYVDPHGDPSPNHPVIVEWEGRAERMASQPPYLLLFDTRFIEIRHAETGRLVQIILGNDVRCLWDGRGTTPTLDTDGRMQPRVHVATIGPPGLPAEQPRSSKAHIQHVFELIQTAHSLPSNDR